MGVKHYPTGSTRPPSIQYPFVFLAFVFGGLARLGYGSVLRMLNGEPFALAINPLLLLGIYFYISICLGAVGFVAFCKNLQLDSKEPWIGYLISFQAGFYFAAVDEI